MNSHISINITNVTGSSLRGMRILKQTKKYFMWGSTMCRPLIEDRFKSSNTKKYTELCSIIYILPQTSTQWFQKGSNLVLKNPKKPCYLVKIERMMLYQQSKACAQITKRTTGFVKGKVILRFAARSFRKWHHVGWHCNRKFFFFYMSLLRKSEDVFSAAIQKYPLKHFWPEWTLQYRLKHTNHCSLLLTLSVPIRKLIKSSNC